MNDKVLTTLVAVAIIVVGVATVYVMNTSGGDQPRPTASGAPPKAKAPGANRAKISEESLTTRRPVTDRPAAAEGALNVVVAITCATRKDQLAPYGGDEAVTPWLSSLADGGARFEDTISAGPWNKPASVAMITGRHAIDLGMIEPGAGSNRRILHDSVLTMAERFVESGYYTLGVTGNFNLNTAVGMGQGFDHYRDSKPGGFAPGNRLTGMATVERAFKMLDARSEAEAERPVYVQLALIDSHKPVRIPKDEFKPFESPDIKFAPYLAAIKRTDTALKKLEAGLASRGLTAENTILVVVGDHGEGLQHPDHHMRNHGHQLYRTVVEVPWLVRGPGVKAGHVVKGLASHVDVMPTVLELAGIPAADVGDLPGDSWAAQLKGEAPRTTRKMAVSDTWYFNGDRASVWTSKHQCQKDFGSEDIDDAFETACFDRGDDPDFEVGIDDPELTAALDAWRTEHWAAYEAWPHKNDMEEVEPLAAPPKKKTKRLPPKGAKGPAGASKAKAKASGSGQASGAPAAP